ncbi:class I SAM-dependent methyltransferase [Petroclostridium sp. X23]|uniref:class I SAM-dependent methyltransferase n=1 Tax=Petroclostridium sp. X23 TaxID=3045146 RepID=UPI0024ACDDC7|nr:class I SAM-dependent methyltransferase [Petroclostridium sp. X23]WHH58696.1 class I SAM-dependent methyltransferase [Petroclostridium sp. X23]
MQSEYFEKLLEGRKQRAVDMEAFWDGRAEQFNASMQKGDPQQMEKLLCFLKEKKILQKDSSVLDIGCGTGQYTVEFAKVSKQVMGIDISSGMMEYAKKNSDQAGLTNVEYLKSDWAEADLKKMGWGKRFDMVFSSMCPAVGSMQTLEKMAQASRNYCFIRRFIRREDSIGESLMQHLGIRRDRDPHNDRNAVYALFNLIWLSGYNPEITYLNTNSEISLSVEEAFEKYVWMFKEQGMEETIKSFFMERQENGFIKGTVCSDTAWMYWKV